MSFKNVIYGVSRRIIAALLIFSMVFCVMPLYINSATKDSEYDLPWLWPVNGSYDIIALDFCADGSKHGLGQAIDIGNNGYNGDERLDVISATSGEVLYIQRSYNETTNRGSGWGNYVIVKSGNVCIVYANLKSVSCKYGEIKAGDLIGKMGMTGNATEVQLHLQAYPYDKDASSTDIFVFDKYKDNPLYITSYRFRSGLTTSSKLYSKYLSSNFSAVSSQMNVYSGSYSGDYFETPIGAIVKSVRYNGARVYNQPITSSSIVGTVPFGEEITVYGRYTDAYGDIWYLVSEASNDKWIPESDIGFCEYTFGAKYEDDFPLNESYSAFLDIYFSGKISVYNIIKSIRAEIRNASGVVASCDIDVASDVFEINNAFSEAFGIDGLADGEYTYEIFVTETAAFGGANVDEKTYSVYKTEFSIDKKASNNVPPLVEEIKIVSMTSTTISLSVTATDNERIHRLSFTIIGDGVEEVLEPTVNGSTYKIEIPYSVLNGPGSYTVTAKAYDPYMNTDESQISFEIPSQSKGETWVVQVSSNLNLRKGPGTNYGIAGKVSNGSMVIVQQVVYNSGDGRYWANIGTGWVALNYASYQSGNLYNITFNCLGGNADYSRIDKGINRPVTIPTTAPTREGYTFLGWSTDPTATVPQYMPGDSYTDNASVVLFAVWEDKTPPVISDVIFVENTGYSDRITLNVIASDNSGIVYYSFDGGISYRRSSILDIFEFQSFPSSIMVKDPSGNTALFSGRTEEIIYKVDQPTLRQRYGTVTVLSAGVEYSVNGSAFALVEVGKHYQFNEGDVILIRYAGAMNGEYDEPVEIKISSYDGTDGFYPKSDFDARVDGDHFLVNASNLTANTLISNLLKQDNIVVKNKDGVTMNGSSDLLYSGCEISIVDDIGVFKTLTIIILGDIDRDGLITQADVITVMKMSNGMIETNDPSDKTICDLDGDGLVTSIDASLIYNKIQ